MQFAPKDDNTATRRAVSGRSLGQVALVLLTAAVALPGTGCSITRSVGNYIAYNDTQNDFVMGFRNHVWARQAWAERGQQFVDQPQYKSFGEGFRAGYVAVAAGGSGCPPAVAPRKYWTWKYQTPEGQAKVAAWFAGFPHGAQAAEEDQAGEYQDIQVSYAIEHQYSGAFSEATSRPATGRATDLEPLPHPAFMTPTDPPLNDSASYRQPPGHFPVPEHLGPVMVGPPVQPAPNMPVAFQYPVPHIPQPAMNAWPQ